MRKIVFVFVMLCASVTSYAIELKQLIPMEEEKVAAIKEMLSDENYYFAPKYQDREAWKQAFQTVNIKALRKQADKLVAEDGTCSMPYFQEEWIDKWWNVKKTNDSDTGKKLLSKRISTPKTLAVAFCATGDQKYEKAAIDALTKLIRQPIWCYPRNYNPETRKASPTIELAAQHFGDVIGSVLYIMDDKIPADLRREAMDSLQNHIFKPIISNVTAGSKERNGWLTGTANWTPACLSGVLMSALTVADKDTRAKIVYVVDRYVDNYILSFKNDGYCTEGMSYYSYGFDKYLTIREGLYRATNGGIDIYKRNPNIRPMMMFPFGMQLYNDIAPAKNFFAAIADCNLKTKPSSNILYYNLKYLGIENPSFADYDPKKGYGAGSFEMMLKFTDFDSFETIQDGKTYSEADRLRSFFDESGVLVVRSLPDAASNISATLKGGNNKEMHNHNDVGSYSLIMDNVFMLEDPGIAPYTGKTFGPHRYEIKTLSSYGHSTPVVDEVYQNNCGTTAPTLQSDFSEKSDKWAIELKDFYDVEDLKSIKRSFEFSRGAKSVLSVKDEFSADSEHVWGTSVSTRAEVTVKKNSFVLNRDGKLMTAKVKASSPVEITTETIGGSGGEARDPFTRILIKFTGTPAKAASISVTYSE